MTKEERLDWLCRLRSEIYVYMPNEWLKSMDEALTDSIKALEQDCVGTTQNCVENALGALDCISRQAIDEVKELMTDINGNTVYAVKMSNIRQLPSVNPQEPKTGHWEWVQYDSNPNIGDWHCSECRCIAVECVGKEEEGGIPLYKYCPQCGADMRGEI